MRTADLHCDTVFEILAGEDLGRGNPAGHVDIPRLRAGEVALQFFAMFLSSHSPPDEAFTRTNQYLDALEAEVARHPDHLALAETAADVEQAVAAGRIAVVRAVENGFAIEERLDRIEALRRRGVRYLTLTHSVNLPWAGSSGEQGPGLTAFGREVVSAMEDLGILVDVSHVSRTCFWDVVQVARKPFLASHSSAHALCPSARNLDDEQLRAVAGAGGVVGINFFPSFLDAGWMKAAEARTADLFARFQAIEGDPRNDPAARLVASRVITAEFQDRMADVRIPIDRIADHVLHMVEVMGDAHVAFGADLDGVPDLPGGMTGAEVYPRILDLLRARGLGEAALQRIAWGNVLRVLRSADAC